MKKLFELSQLMGAVVINNCSIVRLSTGEMAIWKGGEINPPLDGWQEFFDENLNSVKIPVEF